jgi:hypothetical protein
MSCHGTSDSPRTFNIHEEARKSEDAILVVGDIDAGLDEEKGERDQTRSH